MLYGNFDLKVSVLTRKTILKGEFVFEDFLRIDGVLEGNLRAMSKLVISKTANVVADISAKELELYGKLDGNVSADIFIIRAGASFSGKVNAKDFIIEDGASVNLYAKVES